MKNIIIIPTDDRIVVVVVYNMFSIYYTNMIYVLRVCQNDFFRKKTDYLDFSNIFTLDLPA